MPINAERRRKLYNTKAWRDARRRVLARAGGRCECRGECGEHAHLRCRARNAGNGLFGVAHRDHNSGELVPDDELVAMCAACHLRYDQDQHLRARWVNRFEELERAGQLTLKL